MSWNRERCWWGDGVGMFLPLARWQEARSVLLQGKALRLPVPHNLTPNLNSIRLFKCRDCVTDLFSWLFTPNFHLIHALAPFPCCCFPILFPFYCWLNRSSEFLSLSLSAPPRSTHLMSAESIINDLRGLAVTGALHGLSQGESDNAPCPGAAAGLQ